jgi:hypothetical protein
MFEVNRMKTNYTILDTNQYAIYHLTSSNVEAEGDFVSSQLFKRVFIQRPIKSNSVVHIVRTIWLLYQPLMILRKTIALIKQLTGIRNNRLFIRFVIKLFVQTT